MKKLLVVSGFLLVLVGCGHKNQENKNENQNDYSVVFENEELKITEEKIANNMNGALCIAGEKISIKETLGRNIECDWDQKEVDNYKVKEESCSLFNYKEQIFYKVLRKIDESKGGSNYEIFIDDKFITKEYLGENSELEQIKSIKQIDNNFVVEFPSSILVNGKKLNNFDFNHIYSPQEFSSKFLYFLSKENKVAINYDNKIIDLPYSRTPKFTDNCGEGIFEIKSSKDKKFIYFFGLKDDNWYYVEIRSKK